MDCKTKIVEFHELQEDYESIFREEKELMGSFYDLIYFLKMEQLIREGGQL